MRIPPFLCVGRRSEAHFDLAAPHTAGGDATEAFFGLHRFDVLEKPQYQRLQIGVIDGEEPTIEGGVLRGKGSQVPYAEPSWLADGYYSPYFKEVRFVPLSHFCVYVWNVSELQN